MHFSSSIVENPFHLQPRLIYYFPVSDPMTSETKMAAEVVTVEWKLCVKKFCLEEVSVLYRYKYT